MTVMRTLLSWSTGKDSAWALHVLRQRPDVADFVAEVGDRKGAKG
jgi:diphthamide synthase (EF-2-diphthine--ammonia ligase)